MPQAGEKSGSAGFKVSDVRPGHSALEEGVKGPAAITGEVSNIIHRTFHTRTRSAGLGQSRTGVLSPIDLRNAWSQMVRLGIRDFALAPESLQVEAATTKMATAP